MKLELKHITPYPIGLKLIQDLSEHHPSTLVQNQPLKKVVSYCGYQQLGYTSIYYELLDNKGGGNDYLHVFKPILRPLSDLTKEIGINEEEYQIPIGSIFYDWRKDLIVKMSFDVNGYLNEFWLDYPEGGGDYVCESSVTRADWETLFKWHFDVFGLIEKGLAIDINTI